MFENIALNVVIGLVLVYLLYSLLITVIGEIAGSALGLRARILRMAIERMLNDGYYKKVMDSNSAPRGRLGRFWYAIQNNIIVFFLRQRKDFKESVAGRFYQYPSVKYLAKFESAQKLPFQGTKPSYLSAENFAVSLLNFVAEKGAGETLMEKVQFALRNNTLHIEEETLGQLNDMLSNSENNLDVFRDKLMKWFNETMDRATGWYKEKLQQVLFVLGFSLAVIFNIDSISISKFLLKDKNAREQMAGMAVAISKDTLRYHALLDKNDTINRQAILDSSYRRISQDLDQSNKILGLGWHFDTRTKNWMFDRRVAPHDSVTVFADQFINYDTTLNRLRYRQATNWIIWDSLKSRLERDRQDSLTLEKTIALRQKQAPVRDTDVFLKSATQLKDTLISHIQRRNDSIPLARQNLENDSADIVKCSRVLAFYTARITNLVNGKMITVDSVVNKLATDSTVAFFGKRRYNAFEKTVFVLGAPFRLPLSLLGWLLTGFALSLGAPFWFGILNKLVALRSSGVKPEEKTDKFSNEPTTLGGEPPGKPGMAVFGASSDSKMNALQKLKKEMVDEYGVSGVGIKPTLQAPGYALVAFVISQSVADYMISKYGSPVKSSTGQEYPVTYTVQPVNNIHAAAGSAISNKNNLSRAGTLGCFMQKKGDNGTYFISCWHVLKDNNDWKSTALKERVIIEHQGEGIVEIGRVLDGYLSSPLDPGADIGIVSCNAKEILSNPGLLIKGQQREVVEYDALVSTPVSLYGKASKLKKARIYLHSIDIDIVYPGGETRRMNDMFTLITAGETVAGQTLTTGGDSGAVVVDEAGVPLGMVIGGNSNFSYAMKFTNIFSGTSAYSAYYFKIFSA